MESPFPPSSASLPSPPKVRLVPPQDYPNVIDTLYKVWPSEPDYDYARDLAQATVIWAIGQDPIQAVVVMHPVNNEQMHLRYIAVHPQYQKEGLGHVLLEHVIRMHGCKVLTLNVRVGNDRAIQLYTQFGFMVSEQKDQLYAPNDQGSTEGFVMVRRPHTGACCNWRYTCEID